MKKIVNIEQEFCDDCGKKTYAHNCIGCGVCYCYDCSKRLFKELKFSVHFGGSGEAQICSKCLANPPEKIKELLKSYLAINNLRSEYKVWWEEFDKRANIAEAHNEKLRKEYELKYGRI